MTKWEYKYIEAYRSEIQKVNGERIGVLKKSQGFFAAGVGGDFEYPSVSEFLEKSGQEGWDVVGICPASEDMDRWRLVLKRPIL